MCSHCLVHCTTSTVLVQVQYIALQVQVQPSKRWRETFSRHDMWHYYVLRCTFLFCCAWVTTRQTGPHNRPHARHQAQPQAHSQTKVPGPCRVCFWDWDRGGGRKPPISLSLTHQCQSPVACFNPVRWAVAVAYHYLCKKGDKMILLCCCRHSPSPPLVSTER